MLRFESFCTPCVYPCGAVGFSFTTGQILKLIEGTRGRKKIQKMYWATGPTYLHMFLFQESTELLDKEKKLKEARER